MVPELLLPAGSIEKLDYAIEYGADAVYFGVVDFSLRTMRKGDVITYENLSNAVNLARQKGAKAYMTLNIFAYNSDIEKLMGKIDVIKSANPDAIILSDFGIFNIVKKYMPEMPIHISTQTNILNYETVRFWRDLGAARCILARELPINDVAEIKRKVPDIELEVFVHGAQCVSYSGRCLLSDYMTKGERKANQGGCSQPCRWSYKLVEETRPNEYYEIEQNERGTHILSPKDLALINYIPQLTDAGVDSLKIEGRTKSLYYVSAAARAYRRAIDNYKNNLSPSFNYMEELEKIGNRGYTQGFYLGDNNSESYSYDISKGLAGADFLAIVTGREDNYIKVKIKNKINLNDEVEIITPNETIQAKVIKILDKNNESAEVANTNEEPKILLDKNNFDYKYALIRTIGIKNKRCL